MKRKTLSWEEVQKIAKEVEKLDEEYKPDKWQTRVLDHQGNIILRTGRQIGKSVTISKKSTRLAIDHPGTTILMIAAAQRQSSELFQKTIKHLGRINDEVLKRCGGFKPKSNLSPRQNDDLRRKFEAEYGIFEGVTTKTECNLKNKVRILSLPTGKTGAYIRCYTVDFLIGDEAAYIAEPVWTALCPMLATSKKMRGFGWEILLSTPFGKGGHYYECEHDSDFLFIYESSEDCKRISRDFLAKKRRTLSKREYAREFLGQYVDEFDQFFSTKLIKARQTFISWELKQDYDKTKKYYLGVDIARYGADENAFVIAELSANNKLKIVNTLTTERKSLTDTVGRIVALDKLYNFRRIFTDDSGLGAGVTDMLLEHFKKSKVFGINNSSKTVDDDKKKGILKEDLYSNALCLMEKKVNPIEIIAGTKLERSLKCMTFEYTSNANLKIYGKYSHLSEAFVRACWCVKAKHLNLFVS